MLPPEFTEPFIHEDRQFQAMVTEFDEKADGLKPGHSTRVVRLLVDDKDAAFLNDGERVLRVSTGIHYRLRTPVKIGIGVTEIDLHPDGHRMERRI